MNKKRYMRYLIFGLLVSFLLAGQAIAAPVVPTFDLYETVDNTPTGTPAEMGPLVDISSGRSTLPLDLTLYIVLLDSLDTTNHSLDNWSDALQFVFVGSTDSIGADGPDPAPSATVQLFSDPAFSSLPTSDIIAGIDSSNFISEVTESSFPLTVTDSTGATLFQANFNVHSAEEVPEPSTLLLLGTGLAGVGLLRRRFKK